MAPLDFQKNICYIFNRLIHPSSLPVFSTRSWSIGVSTTPPKSHRDTTQCLSFISYSSSFIALSCPIASLSSPSKLVVSLCRVTNNYFLKNHNLFKTIVILNYHPILTYSNQNFALNFNCSTSCIHNVKIFFALASIPY